jgi:hypothetical protein
MPILLWVVFPLAVWSACMEQLAPISKRSAGFASGLPKDLENLRQ